MAKSINNVITHGLSGKVGGMLVFSQRNGKTIVSRIPRRPATLASAIVTQNEKFTMASAYATAILQDPIVKANYAVQAKNRGLSAYNVAVGDYLNAPVIHNVIVSGYSGTVGEKILIQATDDFSVESVTVRIEKTDGTLIEEGNAVELPFHWEYTATTANGAIAGCKVLVTAKDLPQNETQKEIIL